MNPDPEILMRWCQRRLGPSRCRVIRFCRRPSSDRIGWWDWQGTIWINLHYIRWRTQLYRAAAHEWTHAQQYWKDYKKGIRLGWDNPLEQEARRRERTLEFRVPRFARHKLKK